MWVPGGTGSPLGAGLFGEVHDGLAGMFGVHELAEILDARTREKIVSLEPADRDDADAVLLLPSQREELAWARKAGKLVVCFRLEDHADRLPRPDCDLDVRRSVDPADRGKGLFVWPAFPHRNWPAYAPADVLPPPYDRGPPPLGELPIVGFCGKEGHGRDRWLEDLESSVGVAPWVIRRKEFTPGIADQGVFAARRLEYEHHLARCHFILCPPGAGLYTYRLFEALSFGAVPILPPTCGRLPEALETIGPVHFSVRMEMGEKVADAVKRWLACMDYAMGRAIARCAWLAVKPSGAVGALAARIRKMLEEKA